MKLWVILPAFLDLKPFGIQLSTWEMLSLFHKIVQIISQCEQRDFVLAASFIQLHVFPLESHQVVSLLKVMEFVSEI